MAVAISRLPIVVSALHAPLKYGSDPSAGFELSGFRDSMKSMGYEGRELAASTSPSASFSPNTIHPVPGRALARAARGSVPLVPAAPEARGRAGATSCRRRGLVSYRVGFGPNRAARNDAGMSFETARAWRGGGGTRHRIVGARTVRRFGTRLWPRSKRKVNALFS